MHGSTIEHISISHQRDSCTYENVHCVKGKSDRKSSHKRNFQCIQFSCGIGFFLLLLSLSQCATEEPQRDTERVTHQYSMACNWIICKCNTMAWHTHRVRCTRQWSKVKLRFSIIAQTRQNVKLL